MSSHCFYCYDIPCTCGKVYDDEHLSNEVLFNVKQKIESILFERQNGREQRIKKLEDHSKKFSEYIERLEEH
jgi:hypothetical protein